MARWPRRGQGGGVGIFGGSRIYRGRPCGRHRAPDGPKVLPVARRRPACTPLLQDLEQRDTPRPATAESRSRSRSPARVARSRRTPARLVRSGAARAPGGAGGRGTSPRARRIARSGRSLARRRRATQTRASRPSAPRGLARRGGISIERRARAGRRLPKLTFADKRCHVCKVVALKTAPRTLRVCGARLVAPRRGTCLRASALLSAGARTC